MDESQARIPLYRVRGNGALMTLDPVPNLGGGVQYLSLSAGTSHSYIPGAVEEITDPLEYETFAPLLEGVLPRLEQRRKEAAVLAAKQQEDAEKRRREAEKLRELAPLRREFGVDEPRYLAHPDVLHSVLYALKDGQPLASEQEEWLRKNQLERLVLLGWERQAERLDAEAAVAGNPDAVANAAARASSLWRRAGKPERALASTASLDPRPPTLERRASAVVLTTRGGAFRDLGDLANAERCGLEAVSYDSSSSFPYSLLGAVYYQMGDAARGDEYFARAEALGARGESRDREIRRAVDRAEAEEQKRLATHLLAKDPKRYSWAERYARGAR